MEEGFFWEVLYSINVSIPYIFLLCKLNREAKIIIFSFFFCFFLFFKFRIPLSGNKELLLPGENAINPFIGSKQHKGKRFFVREESLPFFFRYSLTFRQIIYSKQKPDEYRTGLLFFLSRVFWFLYPTVHRVTRFNCSTAHTQSHPTPYFILSFGFIRLHAAQSQTI